MTQKGFFKVISGLLTDISARLILTLSTISDLSVLTGNILFAIVLLTLAIWIESNLI